MKVTKIIPYVVTAGVSGFASYMIFNKKARNKAMDMMGTAMEDMGKTLKK